MLKRLTLTALAATLAIACAEDQSPSQPAESADAPAKAADTPAAISPALSTAPIANGAVTNAAFWQDGDNALILGAAGISGLEIYSAAGERLHTDDSIEAGLVTVIPASGDTAPLVVVYDANAGGLRAFDVDPAGPSLQSVMVETLVIADEVTGLCHYRSRLSGADYVYAATDAGTIMHYEVFAAGDGYAGRLLRTIPSAKGSGFCAADERDGSLYIAEDSNGVWRIGAEAEDDTTREAVDLLAPFGSLSDDIKGIAVYPVSTDVAYLLVADIGNEELAVYTLPEGEKVGTVSVDNLGEPEGLSLSAGPFPGFEGGVLAIADEDQGDDGSDVKLVDISALGAALGLEAAGSLPDVVRAHVVRPVYESEVIPTYGDSADDPAIWVHPEDANKSLVIGTGKKSGLYVFDLEGNLLDELPDGRMNNVDVRDGFPLGGATVPLVTASNRSNDSIAIYRLDAAARTLVEVADGVIPTGFPDPYGLCMYHSPASDNFYVFVNDADSGLLRQWHLTDNGEGKVAAEPVRDIPVGSQAEGCVVDDAHETLYVAEEGIGLWKYGAEPDAGEERVSIDKTDDNGRLTSDVEGVALYKTGGESGYLVVSNQGANNYALYRREGDNEFVGMFHIVANPELGIDGASETDGLDVTSAALGAAFPDGLLVVQDGRNIAPEERQNFKYVSWRDIAEALDLP